MLVERVAERGHPVPRFIEADLKDIGALRGGAIEQVGREDGPIRGLVNNAANDDRHRHRGRLGRLWDERMAVNLRHQFFAAQAVRPQMRDAGGGAIVNLGSMSWMAGEADCIAYVTAKSAVNGLTRGLARELGPERIRVNCVVPGWVMTERQLALWVTPEGEELIDREPVPAGPPLPARHRAHGAVARSRRQPDVLLTELHRGCGLGLRRQAREGEGRCDGS